jgi:hypothetical protein
MKTIPHVSEEFAKFSDIFCGIEPILALKCLSSQAFEPAHKFAGEIISFGLEVVSTRKD